METLFWTVLGYLVWCVATFFCMRAMKLGQLGNRPISFLCVVIAAPLVLLDCMIDKKAVR